MFMKDLRISAIFRHLTGSVARWVYGSVLFLVAQSAWATQTLGQIGTYQQTTATGLSEGLYYFALFFGLLMVVVGIIMWGYAHKKHESPMVAIVIIIAGILLASVIEVIDVGSATVFSGTNHSQINSVLSSD
jgi:magnesium-transporting ATPase (P-type)